MGQSQSSKFDRLFTLICTDNAEEFTRQLNSCSSAEQTRCLSNLSDADKNVTLLMYAAFYGNKNICRLLLESGAQLSSRDNEGHNVLFYSIAGQSYNVAKYLIEASIAQFDGEKQKNFLNNLDNTGETCLHEAVNIHALPCIELLIKYGVDINIANKAGITPLHRAIDLGHSDTVRVLIKHNAELNTKDISGWSPLHVACANNDMELVRLLITRGARLNVTDIYGNSPLRWAHQTGSKEVFEYLKSQGGKEYGTGTTGRKTDQRSNKKKASLSRSYTATAAIDKTVSN